MPRRISQIFTTTCLTGLFFLFIVNCGGGGGGGDSSNSESIVESIVLSANPTEVASGGTTTLTWSSTDVTSCSASGDWSGTKNPIGTEQISNITSNSSFTLTCTTVSGGSINKTVAVNILGNSTASLALSANPTEVASGGTTTLAWSSTDVTSCSASGDWSGTKNPNGTEQISNITSNSSFTLTCTTASSGSINKTVAVNILGNSTAVFPLHKENGKRYLLDAQGNPFLIHGDSAWSLIAELTSNEVDQYLDDRKARGFNAILVNLIEHEFSSNAPANAYGELPFTIPGRFNTPNDKYFDYAVSVVQKAAERNILVLLTPAYLGYGGGNQGWYIEMTSSNSLDDLRNYGRYLAQKFQNLHNIIWVEGGDYTPSDLSVVDAIASEINSFDSSWLHTYHGSRGTSALDNAGNYNWLSVNNIYTSDNDVTLHALAEFNNSMMPYFLIEAVYENEGGTTQTLRAQAYQAVLAGAMGQLMGNNPIWCFSAGCSSNPSTTWGQELDSNLAISMQRLRALLEIHYWWLLQPASSLVSSGYAALASDRTFALAYVESNVTVQLSALAGSSISASWYNPYTGNLQIIGTYPTSGPQSYSTPGNNGNGTDWVLVLQSQ